MRKLQLNNSGVRFDEAAHRYWLGDKELFGITGVLSRQLFTDKYDGVPQSVLNRAAEYGSNVHATIELCDSLGDFSNQDENYAAYRKLMEDNGLSTVRNEYIVTDGKQYASAIDLTATDKDGNIALIDIKTTSKLDKEYVSWQLSIYRHLFYLQNPHLKGMVKKLYALWMPKPQYGTPTLVEVSQKEDKLVMELLEADKNNGLFQNHGASALSLTDDAVSEAVEIVRGLAEAKKREADLKKGLLELMQKSDVKSFKNDRILLTRVIPSNEETYTLDTARLKEEFPEIYNKLLKKKAKPSESIRIKIY